MNKLPKIIRLCLLPLAWLYGLIVFVRNKLYDWNIKKSFSAEIPTIVLGNLTVGGTGKTPMTILITNFLKQYFSVAIISRGYKRKTKDCLITYGNHSPDEIGDEPLLMAEKTKVPVVVCPNRIKAITMAKKYLPNTELVILDDGLQHRQLKPDLKILLIDYNRPIFDDYFLPSGNLRDNTYRIKQADIIIFTKCPAELNIPQAKELTRKTGKSLKNVFFTKLTYSPPINPFTQKTLSFEQMKNFSILLFSGIANPSPLEEFVKKNSLSLKILIFPDHKEYKFGDIKKIFYNFAQLYTKQKIILTTEKDFVKIKHLDIAQEYKPYFYVLPVNFEFLFGTENQFKQKILNYGRKLTGKNS